MKKYEMFPEGTKKLAAYFSRGLLAEAMVIIK